jgi:hypothetical protein
VISVPELPSAPGERLALPPWPAGAGRPALRRLTTLGLALVVLAVLAIPVATGTIRLPGAGSATAAPERQASPRAGGFAAGTDLERAQAQPRAAPGASEARPASGRVVAPTHASALFAQHSWYVLKPAPVPPPAPPPPAPEPTAPPFPYAFVGSYAPTGDQPVYFLARGDSVIDAHVGDRLDGVYQFESAADGQLVFVYLPLNIRQNLAAGASK